MEEFTLIYVAVKGYSVDVWQPVKAIHIHDNCFRILESSSDPEHDYWEFSYDDVVRCENYIFSEGENGLVARSKCKDNL